MIIGFSGKAGSGKSTAANFLANEHWFIKHKMAKPLKNMCRALGMSEEQIEGNLKEVPDPMLDGKTPRYVMQSLGTEWGRKLIGESLWTDAWLATRPENSDIVVDDIRFLNELTTVRSLGGKIIKIVRNLEETESEHESENALHDASFDDIIINDGTIAHLQLNVYRSVFG